MSVIEPYRAPTSGGLHSRFLPTTPAAGYVKGAQESLPRSLHRISSEQFTIAIDSLCAPDRPIEHAVPTAIEALGRIRSVLRLVRDQIGDESYRTENTILRETQENLEQYVAGRPPVAALDQLTAHYRQQLQPDALSALRVRLVQRAQIQRLTAAAESGDGEELIQRIRRARARFDAWPLAEDDIRIYGRDPVADDFSAISPGLGATYRRGRRRLSKCTQHPTAAGFAAWGSETRVLAHQLEILSAAWPEILTGMARGLHQLTEVLHEEFGLAELLRSIHEQPHLCPDDTDRSLVVALAQQHRRDLQSISTTLGQRIYTEKPGAFLSRLNGYWAASTPEFHARPAVTPGPQYRFLSETDCSFGPTAGNFPRLT